MAKPFDDGNSSDPHAQEHIPREIQLSLANRTGSATTSDQYSPSPLAHAHSFRRQAEYPDRSAQAPSCRGLLTCGMNATTDSPLAGEPQRIQPAMLDGGSDSPLTTQSRGFHDEIGNEEALVRQFGIQLRQMGDQLHTYHMERVVAWDQRRWPVWYWTFLNFFMQTMAIFRMPRWR